VIVLSSGLVLLLVRSTEDRIMGRHGTNFPSHGTFVKKKELLDVCGGVSCHTYTRTNICRYMWNCSVVSISWGRGHTV
jgi:hypothetical protein